MTFCDELQGADFALFSLCSSAADGRHVARGPGGRPRELGFRRGDVQTGGAEERTAGRAANLSLLFFFPQLGQFVVFQSF